MTFHPHDIVMDGNGKIYEVWESNRSGNIFLFREARVKLWFWLKAADVRKIGRL